LCKGKIIFEDGTGSRRPLKDVGDVGLSPYQVLNKVVYQHDTMGINHKVSKWLHR